MSKAPPLTTLQKVSSGQLGGGAPPQSRTLSEELRDGALPAYILAALLVITAVVELLTGGPLAWGLSRQTLSDGRWFTLLSHPIAHGSLAHLLMNCSALIGLTLATRPLLGNDFKGWGRYGIVLSGAAIASALAYLVLHPSDGLPMVGASGAICGLWGLAVRCDPDTGLLRGLWSKPVRSGVSRFTMTNIVLFGILFLLVWLQGGTGGLAWEAHLGGFTFGLLAARWLIKPYEQAMIAEPAATS